MAIIKPFKALRPAKDKAAVVSATAYDFSNKDKSNEDLSQNPYSYHNIVKPYLYFKGEKKNPEKHFPLGLENLQKFKENGWLIKDEEDSYYIYRVIKGSNAYTGIIAAASIDDYNNNIILKHENTLTEKQNELAEHIKWFKQLGNPVLLTYPDSDAIDQIVEHYIENHIPEYNFISKDQLKHNLWVVNDKEDVQLIAEEFKKIPSLYIADGHHRSAGSAAYADSVGDSAKDAHRQFPVCLIPFNKLSIFEYHRLIKDNNVNTEDFLSRLAESFEVIPSGPLPVQPLKQGEFGIYISNHGYLLKLKSNLQEKLIGTLEKLDVSVVEQFILKDILNINDSKTDKRISFLDGTKGIGFLQENVDNGNYNIAITLFRTSVEEVVAVADQKLIMPPKSTWIEPKLRSGLIIYETE